MKKIILPIILVILAAGAIIVFSRNKLNINATKNMQKYASFENKSEPKFRFNYPLFDHWEIDVGETASGEMWVRYMPDKSVGVDFEMPPGLYFRFLKSAPDESLWQKAVLNSQGTKFVDVGNENNTAGLRSIFQIKDKFLEITDPRGAKHENFDGNLVWKILVESIKAE